MLLRSKPVLLAICLSIPSAAFAATLRVPDAPHGILTIQDALDAAAANDTILIDPGIYRGSFRVTNKSGLRIRGAVPGKVVIDARDSALAAVGPGLVLDHCDDAQVESLVVQHALLTLADKGVGIQVKQSLAVTFSNIVVADCEEEGLEVDGAGAKLVNCEFSGNAGGVKISGDNASLSKVRVHNDSIRGIAVFGNQSGAKDCEVGAILSGGGLSITGETPTVVRCTVTGVFDPNSNGITTTGSGPLISDNTIRGCTIGLYVVYGAFGQVKKNTIEDCTGSGFRTGDVSHQLTIKDNVVRRCGNATAAGYHIDGITQVLKNNRAEDCGGNGFLLLSTDFELTEDTALRCARDGFNLETTADRAALKNCVAKDNRGEGIENSAPNISLIGNSSKRNRIDFANDGTVQSANGNDFDVVNAPAPEID